MQSDRSDSSGPLSQRIHSQGRAANGSGTITDMRGRHRIQAEVKRLEQDARLLEEEIEQLDRLESSSTACKELLGSIKSRPDPLLPVTTGPANPTWDRWFEGPQEANKCCCWMF